MASKALWAVALVAFVAAVAFVYSVFKPESASASFQDPAGDVVGTAPREVLDALDITSAEVVRRRSEFEFVFEMANPVERSVGDGATRTFTVRLRSGTRGYTVRARIAPANSDATVLYDDDPGHPYVLDDPALQGRRVIVRAPADALDGIAATFTWGVAVRVDGGEDKAPPDSSAVFPGRAA